MNFKKIASEGNRCLKCECLDRRPKTATKVVDSIALDFAKDLLLFGQQNGNCPNGVIILAMKIAAHTAIGATLAYNRNPQEWKAPWCATKEELVEKAAEIFQAEMDQALGNLTIKE